MLFRLFLASVLAFCMLSPARAVDFTEVLMDDDGCPLRDDPNLTSLRTSSTVAKAECPTPKDREGKPERLFAPDLTLGLAAYHALLWTPPDETPGYPGAVPQSGEEKHRRGDLARRIRNAKDDTPTAEEITLMKKLLGKLYGPAVVSVVFPRLDPATAKK